MADEAYQRVVSAVVEVAPLASSDAIKGHLGESTDVWPAPIQRGLRGRLIASTSTSTPRAGHSTGLDIRDTESYKLSPIASSRLSITAHKL